MAELSLFKLIMPLLCCQDDNKKSCQLKVGNSLYAAMRTINLQLLV